MKKTLRDRLFASTQPRNAEATAHKKESALAKINELEASSTAPVRPRRTVGLTEARLRAANKQSWLTSASGWSNFFGRFTR